MAWLEGSQLQMSSSAEGPFQRLSGDGRKFTVKWAQDDEGRLVQAAGGLYRLLVMGCSEVAQC
jgi:hypothetical protein